MAGFDHANLILFPVVRLVLAAALICVGVDAIELDVADAALRRANALARGDGRALTAFHRKYVIPVSKGELQEIEVITEFRRAVSEAEQRRVGEPEMATLRRLEQTLAPFKRRVSVVAHVRFSPQTAYVTLPQYDVSIPDAPGSRDGVRPLDLRRTPLYTGSRGNTFLAGADVEAVFDAAAIGQTRRRIAVGLQGKELAGASFDFASID